MRWLPLIAGLLTVTIAGGGCISTPSKDKEAAASGPVFADLRTSSASGKSDEEVERMRPGDKIMINFAQPGTPELTLTNTIRDDGTVTLLSNRVFTAAGRTIREFEQEVYKNYGPNSYRIGVTDPDKP